MTQHHCCSLLALAVCVAVGQASAEEPSSLLGGLPTLPGASADKGCIVMEAPCVRLWGDLKPAERASIWPFLDEASKLSYWRGMTHEERKGLRENLSERDREALRRRFSVDRTGPQREGQKPRLCGEDRRLMREQITEVHLQLMERHGAVEQAGAPDMSGRPMIRNGRPGGPHDERAPHP